MFHRAEDGIDMLVMAGFWLSEDRKFRELLATKASNGVRVRIALADPSCEAGRQRGVEEGIGDAIGGKIRNVAHNDRPLMDVEGIEFRLHDTVLYNSIYRGDDELLANAHIHGAAAYEAPILHLRRLPEGDLFRAYRDSFERIWTAARPLPDSLVAVA